MAKTRRSAIVTSDGILDLPKDAPVHINQDFEAPELMGRMVVRTRSDMSIALARQLWEQGHYDIILGKSGGSRIGLHIASRTNGEDADGEFDERNHTISLPVSILSLRNVQVRQNGVRDDLLSVLREMADERDIAVGRLLLADPKDSLSKGQILNAVRNNQLALRLHQTSIADAVSEDGVLNLPLEDLHYVLCEANFRTEQKRAALRYGKHGLTGIQEEKNGRPDRIDGKEFFVGGIKISIGPFIAVIDEQTNMDGVIHLAARALDGIRTTGLSVSRQVELFNKLYSTVKLQDVRVKMRFYYGSKEMQQFAYEIINRKTLFEGVDLSDVLQLEKQTDLLATMMQEVNPSVADGDPAAYMIGPGRAHKVPWVDHPSHGFQEMHYKITAPKFAAGDAEYCVAGTEMPQAAVPLAERLGYVGRSQSHSKMFLSHGFPDMETVQHMHESGFGVFVAHDIRTHPDAYSSETPLWKDGSPLHINNLFMTDGEFASMQRLHRCGDGVKFLVVRHPAKDVFEEVDELPEQILEWHETGFWVSPEHKELVKKANNIIAMYGSHVKGVDKALEPQIANFAIRMKKLFRDSFAFIHGRGAGAMYLADKVARRLPEYTDEEMEPAVSMGVGIDLEQVGQDINHHPHAQVNFRAQSRLTRQKHMNDRAVFNVFNLGGAGTLEEIALTLCSQKLFKNLLTPMIFVDPFGISNEGNNLWQKLEKFISDISTKKTITVHGEEVSTEGLEVPVQLLQGHMQNMVHVVNSYDDAATIIEDFVEDPVRYYTNAKVTKTEFELSYANAVDIRKETRIPMPSWIQGEKYAEYINDPRWESIA